MKKLLSVALIVCGIFIFAGCSSEIRLQNNLTSYTIDLQLDVEQHTVTAKQTVDYINKEDIVLKNIKFHLYPNAFRAESKASVVSVSNEVKAYPNGKSFGDISISLVKLENNDANYEICGKDYNILNVNLNKDLYPNDRIEIYIEYKVKLANINHRLGYGENAINLCNFYPVACVYEDGDFVCDLYNQNGDPFYSEVADYFVTIQYPESYTVASSGYQTKVDKTEQTLCSTLQAKCIRDFAIVLSNKFENKNCVYNQNVNINYYYYGDKTPDKTMDLINQTLAFFEQKIGEYPYSTLTVTETNFVHGGMEYPNIVLISDCLADYESYQMVVIHEICHQWWYGVVGNNQYKYGWIDEGLTEFCTLYFYENHQEYNKTIDGLVQSATNSYTTFMKVYKDVLGSVDTSMNRALDQFNTEPEYVYNTYVKGMLMFATIYEIVGQKSFDKALKYYYKQNVFQTVTPERVIKCFSKGSGKNLENLFNSWLDGEVVILNK